ncbi:uncharacterized protein LOC125020889 [Mugil cephalus]|uniref:uncharacterized protein LOC125020889 n=1 Tax=Mugil cephalus TaxID=48193 RepID=UPI001FB7FB0B|nr:uncharacterized protein LOC125020889 [Mugil cephalus]
MGGECFAVQVGLGVSCLALLMSLCLNFILYIKLRATSSTDKNESGYQHTSDEDLVSQHEELYFRDTNHQEQQENPLNDCEQQENPIYGNISTDRGVTPEACYETMTMQRKRERMKPLEPDLNYASLDLKIANKRKKKARHQQGQTHGRNKSQDQLPVHHTPPANTFLEVDADLDAHLPSKDTNTMVSHSSIYLNSQQIAQEAEEMGRGRSIHKERENAGWESMRRREDGGSREWRRDQEGEDRTGGSNGSVCTQLPEADIFQSGADHFTGFFSVDSDQQV